MAGESRCLLVQVERHIRFHSPAVVLSDSAPCSDVCDYDVSTTRTLLLLRLGFLRGALLVEQHTAMRWRTPMSPDRLDPFCACHSIEQLGASLRRSVRS